MHVSENKLLSAAICVELFNVYQYYPDTLHTMAPPVTHRPKSVCANFPLCREIQYQPRKSHEVRTRSDYCSACCFSRPACAYPGCVGRAVPGRGRYVTTLCASHYRDPCNSSRAWPLCSNSKIGCLQLSETSKLGKCFACSQGNLPCLHSLRGCAAHLRGSTSHSISTRKSCGCRAQPLCIYDPLNTSTCASPRCALPVMLATAPLCSDCASGTLPCKNNCSRRSVSGNTGLCLPCSTMSSTTNTSCEAASTAKSTASAGTSALETVGHSPRHSCGNFPICSNSRKQIFSSRTEGSQHRLHRLDFCASCITATPSCCAHPDCSHPPAPFKAGKSSNGFCATHVRDPCHESVREWPKCKHHEVRVFVFRVSASQRFHPVHVKRLSFVFAYVFLIAHSTVIQYTRVLL